MWERRCLTSLWASTACYRDSFTFYPVSYGTFVNMHPATYGEFIYVNGICIYIHPVIYGRFIYMHPVIYIYSCSNNSLIETKYRLFYSKATLIFMGYCLYSMCLFVVVLYGRFQQATYHSVMTNRVELWDTETESAQVWYDSYWFSLFPGLSLYRTGGFAVCKHSISLYLINYVCWQNWVKLAARIQA
jgi:hypothetical protein